MIPWDLKENNIKTVDTTHLIRNKREKSLGDVMQHEQFYLGFMIFAKKFKAWLISH